MATKTNGKKATVKKEVARPPGTANGDGGICDRHGDIWH